jgi:hypothetical protein
MSKNLFEEFALMTAAVSAPLPVPVTALTSENGINPASSQIAAISTITFVP